MNVYIKKKQTHRPRKKTSGYQRGEGQIQATRITNYCI